MIAQAVTLLATFFVIWLSSHFFLDWWRTQFDKEIKQYNLHTDQLNETVEIQYALNSSNKIMFMILHPHAKTTDWNPGNDLSGTVSLPLGYQIAFDYDFQNDHLRVNQRNYSLAKGRIFIYTKNRRIKQWLVPPEFKESVWDQWYFSTVFGSGTLKKNLDEMK